MSFTVPHRVGLAANAAIDITKPWHELQQIAKSETDTGSVDENQDKVIDEAETLTLVNRVATIGDVSDKTALAIKGISSQWSAIDFYSGNTNMWGIGRNADGDFYIDRAGVGNALTIDRNNRNVGIGTSSPSQKLEVIGNIKGTQLCIGSDCRSSWPSFSESDTLQAVTNRGRTTTQNIRSPRFEDNNDPAYYVDPASTSKLATLDVTGNIKASGTVCDKNGCIGGGGGTWPAGSYCILVNGGACPAGFNRVSPSDSFTYPDWAYVSHFYSNIDQNYGSMPFPVCCK